MRYIIVGAGAIGGAIGGALLGHGRDVVFVARGEQLAAIRSGGLRIRTPAGEAVHRVEAQAIGQVQSHPGDVIVMATKSQDTAAALTALRDHVPTDRPIVCAQNGVENERLALRLFRNVYGMYVDVPSEHLTPGVVAVRFERPYGVLDVGRYPSGADPVCRSLARDFRASGFSSSASSDIMRWKYGKLVATLGNSVRAISGFRPQYRAILHRAQREAAACLSAAGIDHVSDADLAVRRSAIPGHQGGHGIPGSGYQSLARQTGTIETDFLNGEIVLLGRLHGVRTPVNEGLQRIARDMARGHLAPASLDLRLSRGGLVPVDVDATRGPSLT